MQLIEKMNSEQIQISKSLYYEDFKNKYSSIKKLELKYEVKPKNTYYSLVRIESNLKDFLLDQIFNYDTVKFDDYINLQKRKLKIIEMLALIEIAYSTSAEIKYKIESPLRFKDIRKKFREITSELNEISATCSIENPENDNEKDVLKLKNIATELKNINLELDEEKREKRTSSITKGTIWAVPILIGIYQLIAMQYFSLNPKTPLIFYGIFIVALYLFFKIENPIALFANFKKEAFSGYKIMLATSIIGILIAIYEQIENNLPIDIESILIGALMFPVMFLSLILLSSSLNARRSFIKNELNDLEGLIRSKIDQ